MGDFFDAGHSFGIYSDRIFSVLIFRPRSAAHPMMFRAYYCTTVGCLLSVLNTEGHYRFLLCLSVLVGI